jgi:hypothetical protein
LAPPPPARRRAPENCDTRDLQQSTRSRQLAELASAAATAVPNSVLSRDERRGGMRLARARLVAYNIDRPNLNDRVG